MTAAANRALMRRFVEFINSADETLGAKLISSNAIFHVPGQRVPMVGPAGYLAIIATMRAGFPDLQWILEEMVAEGDSVAARYTMRGTHSGPFLGVAATRAPVVVQSMAFYRLSGGQFVEEHGLPDMMGLMQQIGAVPGA